MDITSGTSRYAMYIITFGCAWMIQANVWQRISAAVMSTMDSLINTGAMTLALDLNTKEQDENKKLRFSRAATLLVTVCALLIALGLRSILQISWMASMVVGLSYCLYNLLISAEPAAALLLGCPVRPTGHSGGQSFGGGVCGGEPVHQTRLRKGRRLYCRGQPSGAAKVPPAAGVKMPREKPGHPFVETLPHKTEPIPLFVLYGKGCAKPWKKNWICSC